MTTWKKTYEFRCQTAEERERWIGAIKKAMDSVKEIDLFTPPSEEEKKLIVVMRDKIPAKVKEKLSQLTSPAASLEDSNLVRYLRVQNQDPTRAACSFCESVRWRFANKIDSITIADVYHEAKRGFCYIPGSKDKGGKLIHIIKAGRYTSLPESQVLPRQIIKYMVYLREHEILRKGQKDVTIIDLQGVKPLNSTAMIMNKASMYFLDHCYPGTMAHAILFNTPWWIRTAWNMAKPLIPPAQRRRYTLLGSNMKALYAFVNKEALPEEYGGLHSYDHSAWITSRFEAEGVSFSEVSAEQNDEAFMKDVLPIVSGYGLPAAGSLEGQATKCGWMTKQGGSVKSWKKRWCLLNENKLYYYKAKTSSKPQGLIEINQNTGLSLDSKSKSTFFIETARRVFPFRCATEEDRTAWFECLTQVQNQISKSS